MKVWKEFLVLGVAAVGLAWVNFLWHPLRLARVASVTWSQVPPGAMVVDARTAREYAAGHLEGAISLPLEDLQLPSQLADPQQSRQLVIHATRRSSARALYVAQQLSKARGDEVLVATDPPLP